MELNAEIIGRNIPSDQKQLVDGCLKISTKLVFNRRSEYIQVHYILAKQCWFISMWVIKHQRWFSCTTGLTYHKRNLNTIVFVLLRQKTSLGSRKGKQGCKCLGVNCEAQQCSPPPRAGCIAGDLQLAWWVHGGCRPISPLSVLLCPTSFPSECGSGTWDMQELRVHQRGPWARQLRSTPNTHHRAHLPHAAFCFWKSFLLNTK